MVFRKLTARFGKLNNAEIKLESGLNVVYGENESGKSTWCSFIRVMLYGLKTSERDTSTSLADKNRYLPWAGGAMEGRLEVDVKGRRVVIERSSGKSGVMQNFSAYYADTGEVLAGYNGQNAGELLVGLSRDAFERSVFVGTSGLNVGSNDELERRIRSLVATGDEDVSFADANGLLNKWKRERKFNKTGLLPKAEEEYAEICRMLDEGNELSLRRGAAEERLETSSAEAGRIADCISVKRAGYAKEELLRVINVRDQLAATRELAEQKRDELRDGEIEVDREYIYNIRQSLKAIEDAKRLERDTAEITQSAKGQETQIKTEIDLKYSRYAGKTHEEAEREARRDTEEARELSKKRVRGWLFVLAGIFVAVGISALLLSQRQAWTFAAYRDVILIASAAAALLCATGGGISVGVAGKAKRRISELCRKHDCINIEGINEGARGYAESTNRLREAERHTADLEQRLSSNGESMGVTEDFLRLQLRRAGWHNLNEQAVNENLELYELLINECETTEREAELMGVRYEAMVGAIDMGGLSREAQHAGEEDIFPESTIEELKSRLNILDDEIAALNADLTYIRTRESMIGDPFELEIRKDKLQKQMAEYNKEINALTLASYVLEASNSELTGRITPELNRRASTVFARFTGGKYLDVKIRKGFEALAGDGSAAALRSILSLSSGTSDQLYLALRLAVSSMLFSTDMPPLILDDSFVTFDDRRLGSALEYLREEAMLRQVILFTCQEREVNRLREDPEVNIITL